MAYLKDQLSNGFHRIALVGVSFGVGLVFGILAIVVFQNIASQNEQSTQDVARGEFEQTSTNSANKISTTNRNDVGQFQEIFKYESISEQDSALHSILSKATEHELNDWWLQSQTIERDSHRRLAQRVILQNLTTINPQDALRKIEKVSQFEVNALLKSVFSQWSVSKLEGAIEAAGSFSDPRRRIALQAIIEARDDLSESMRRSIASQLSGEETFLKLASDTLASQSITEPKQSWEILLNDSVKDSLQRDSLVIVAEAWGTA